MGKQNDILELNGNKYDARTGALLESAAGHPPTRTIDGFMPTRHSRPRQHSPKNPTPSHAVHQKTIKSKTLMRNTVKKPVISKPVQNMQPSIQKRTIMNPHRMERAASQPKSEHIAKFNTQPVQKSTADLSVKPAPVQQEAPPAINQQKKAVLPLSPFDMALKNADSHKQAPLELPSRRSRLAKKLRVSPRAASMMTGIAAVLVIAGFFLQQNLPQMAVYLASARAGVEAKMPGYKPAGFSLSGPIEYSSGQIALSYHSNSDDRNYKVIQKKSDWNSQALLDNFITASGKDYQTFQDKGKTIYIYDDNSATWVSGGVWFQVEGASSLNSDQLLRIASGL